MIMLGLDMSFTRAGVALIDTKCKEILITNVKGSAGKKFNDNYANAEYASRRLLEAISTYNVPDVVLMEQPFQGAMFSSGLFLLDGVTIKALQSYGVRKIFTFHTSYLNYIKEIKKADKKTSVELALKLLDAYTKHGYTINKKPKKVVHDEAEALIFMTRGIVMYCKDKELINDLCLCALRFKDAKEQEIINL